MEQVGREIVAPDFAEAVAEGERRGVRVIPMGQLPPMVEMFKALGVGLAVAVVFIMTVKPDLFVSAIAVVFGAVLGGAAGFAGVRRMRAA